MWEILFLLGVLILGGVVGSEELVLENDQIERADGDAAVGEIEHQFEEPECLAANMWINEDEIPGNGINDDGSCPDGTFALYQKLGEWRYADFADTYVYTACTIPSSVYSE